MKSDTIITSMIFLMILLFGATMFGMARAGSVEDEAMYQGFVGVMAEKCQNEPTVTTQETFNMCMIQSMDHQLFMYIVTMGDKITELEARIKELEGAE